jgi:hypothetical protein
VTGALGAGVSSAGQQLGTTVTAVGGALATLLSGISPAAAPLLSGTVQSPGGILGSLGHQRAGARRARRQRPIETATHGARMA